MPGEPRIVSLWRGKNQDGFFCSGLMLDECHILTVKHAFDGDPDNRRYFIRLIDGVDGDIQASVIQCHRDRDAALLKLETAARISDRPNLLRDNRRPFDGKPAVVHCVDPDTFSRSTYPSYSIGSFDHETGEYVISPENARGSSGGAITVDGQSIGLLSRRKVDDPLCRAVAMHLLWPWIQDVLGQGSIPQEQIDHSQATPTISQAYLDLVEKVRQHVNALLAHRSVESLVRIWGSDPVAGFDSNDPGGYTQSLLNNLHKATRTAKENWGGLMATDVAEARNRCRAILGELLKLAANPASPGGDVDRVADATPEQLYLTCHYSGTVDVIYCALWNQHHHFTNHGVGNVRSSGAIHLSDLLPQGEGKDLHQVVLRKLWKKVMDEESPGRIDGDDYARLASRIKRQRDRDDHRYFVVADHPDDFRIPDDYPAWKDNLHIGLAFREDGKCMNLFMDETDMIDTAIEYLQLLEKP